MPGPAAMFVQVKTKKCPRCGESVTVAMRRQEYEGLRDRSAPIQETLARFNADTRERFLSGYCPECWDIVFPSEDF